MSQNDFFNKGSQNEFLLENELLSTFQTRPNAKMRIISQINTPDTYNKT